MKTVLCYVLLLLVPFTAFCQQPVIPEFGKIDKADLELTSCSFDTGAVAFKLLDYGKVRFEKSKNLGFDDFRAKPFGVANNNTIQLFRIATERRVRIKVLKPEGIGYTTITIPFFTGEEQINKVTANTYNLNPDGSIEVTKVGKDGIVTQKMTQNRSQLTITFPNVKVGSVVEYKLMMDTENEYYIRNWYFQSIGMPTRLSYYDIDVPLTYGYGEEAFVNHPSAVKTTKQFKYTHDGTNVNMPPIEVPFANRVTYLQNISGIKREPYSGAPWDYMQRIYYHTVVKGDGGANAALTAWRSMANMLSEKGGYDENVMADLKGSEALLQKARQQVDTADKIKTIYDFVRDNFTCTLDGDVFPNEGAEKVWQKRSGSNADINLILVNLLQKAGINALLFMGTTYNNGIVALNYPSHKQFNALLAYIPTAKRYYLLNAANKEDVYYLVPWYMLGTKGLLVNGDESVFLDMADNGQLYKQDVNVDIVMDANGQATGTALIKSDGYAKAPRVNALLRNKEKFVADYLSQPGVTIESLVVKNETDDAQPLEQNFHFSVPVTNSGALYSIGTNWFTGLGKNPFTDNERSTGVEFRYRQTYNLNVNITVPDGYVLEELPKDMNFSMPENAIAASRVVTAAGKKAQLKVTVQYNKPYISTKDYEYLMDFYKKLVSLLGEQVVAKKK